MERIRILSREEITRTEVRFYESAESYQIARNFSMVFHEGVSHKYK